MQNQYVQSTSTHDLHTEVDVPKLFPSARTETSTHDLHTEVDVGAQRYVTLCSTTSTHDLHTEVDEPRYRYRAPEQALQLTTSTRRSTLRGRRRPYWLENFNSRPPHGGRHHDGSPVSNTDGLQLTTSTRRSTLSDMPRGSGGKLQLTTSTRRSTTLYNHIGCVVGTSTHDLHTEVDLRTVGSDNRFSGTSTHDLHTEVDCIHLE